MSSSVKADLDFFNFEVNKFSVFKNREVLDPNYVPNDSLSNRNDVLKALIFRFRRILDEKGNVSTNCLLSGPGGIGKTLVNKFFAKNFRNIALRTFPSEFHVEYFNCLEYRGIGKILKSVLSKVSFTSNAGISDVLAWKVKLIFFRRNGRDFTGNQA